MPNQAIVGILRALLTANTAEYQAGMRGAVDVTKKTTDTIGGLGEKVAKLAPQAERMVKGFQGDKLLYTANNLAAAIEKVGGATKLTAAEQARANATLAAAIDKYAALGQQAPAALIATERATRQTTGASDILKSSFATLTASFSAALIVNRIVGGLVGLANAAVAGAGDLVDLSHKTGLTTETIQRMSFVATQAGGSLEGFTNASFKLGLAIAGGGPSVERAVKDLGLSLAQLQAMKPDQLWVAVTTALEGVKTEQERNRLGVLLMGKTYAEIASAITEGYNQIAKGAKVAGDAQVKAIDDAVDAAQKFERDIAVGFQSAIGNAILWTTALKQATGELGITASTAKVVERAQFLMREGLINARTKDIELTNAAAAVYTDYVQALKDAQIEVNGLKAADREQILAAQKQGEETDILTDRFHVSKLALQLLSEQTKQFGKDATKATRDAKELRQELEDFRQDANSVADKVEAAYDKITDTENFEDIKESIAGVADAMQDVIEKSQSLANRSELDAERIRDLLAVNTPGMFAKGTETRKQMRGVGETLGGDIKAGIGHAFEDVPHFLTSSVLHSGGFLNGLKALGVEMADAIAEPLLKELGLKIAAFFAGRVATRAATTAGATAPGWLSLIPGLGGGGNNQPPAPSKGQPKNPSAPPDTGIVPLPPAQPGRPAPGVPRPPGNVTTALPRYGAPMPIEIVAAPLAMSDASSSSGTSPLVSGDTRVTVINQMSVQAIDALGIARFIQSPNFTNEFAKAAERNANYLTTRIARAQRGIR